MRLRPYQTLVEPLLALLLRRRRLAALGGTAPARIAIDWRRDADCRQPCPLPRDPVPRLIRRYVDRDAAGGGRRLRPMAMVIDLARLPDRAAFDDLLKRRSSRTLPKIRKAGRMGYAARPFVIEGHVADVHAVKTSMAMRSGGPVLDRWLLRPGRIATPAAAPVAWGPPTCPMHWIIWWGVFVPEPGHCQNGVPVGERLVAFVKLWRIGDVVHYTEIMGHRDHLDRGVMPLLHRAIVGWLVDGADPAARGARVLLYGALEHGRPGLLTWKKRAGFVPARLVPAA